MNFKRIGMALVSLLLVCCLLVNVSPIKAEATSTAIAATVISAPGVAVIGACLVGLGVLVGIATTDWDNVVNNAVAYYTEQGVIDSDGNMDIYSLTSAGYQYGIAEDMLTGLKDWLFDNEVITETSVTVPSGYWLYNGFQYSPLPNYDTSLYPYACIYVNTYTNKTYLLVSSLPLGYSSQDSALRSDLINPYDEEISYMVATLSSGYWGAFTSGTYAAHASIISYSWRCYWCWANYDVMKSDNSECILAASEPIKESSTTISLNGDLIMGEIAFAADSIAAGYTAWAENYVDLSVYDPDLPSAIYPIVYSPTYENLYSVTQEEVWAGLSSAISPNPSDPELPGVDTESIAGALGDVQTVDFIKALVESLTGIETIPYIPPNIEDSIESLPEILDSILDSIETIPIGQQDILDYIEQLPNGFEDWFDRIGTGVEALPDAWAVGWGNILDGIEAIPDAFAIWLDDIKTNVADIAKSLSITADAVADKVVGAIEATVVPDKDYLSDKVNALLAEYAFADSIVTTAKTIKTGLAGITTEPPVIYIHLEDTRGSYNIGGTVPFLDLRWYAEYKPTVDTIISAFLWICFVWHILLKLPGIISGMPGDFVMSGVHHIGMTESLPIRKTEYEVQRISNRETIRKGPNK